MALDTGKTYINHDGTWVELDTGGGGSVSDGDYGDITVSGAGATWTIDNDAVTYAKIQNVTDNRLLGRSAGSSGDVQEITVGPGLTLSGGSLITTPYTSSGGGRLPSWNNAPASPSAYDDEFDTGSLDAKWTPFGRSTTNPTTTGTINYLANLTTPIVDVVTVPSWMCLQSDNSTIKEFGIQQAITLDTNCTIFFSLNCTASGHGGTNRSNVYLMLRNSSGVTDSINTGAQKSNTGNYYRWFHQVTNGGSSSLSASQDFTPTENMYGVIWKVGDVYHSGFALGSSGVLSYGISKTKTGTTTLDTLELAATTGPDTPSRISGFDFVRYYPSLVYNFVNS